MGGQRGPWQGRGGRYVTLGPESFRRPRDGETHTTQKAIRKATQRARKGHPHEELRYQVLLFSATLCLCPSAQGLPSPPLQTPPPCNPPPHPGDRHLHVFLVNMYCAGLCCPSALRMALHCFPITTNQAPVCVL